MYEIKDVIHDMKAMAKRRRALLFITPVLFLIASAIALLLIEPQYKSTTTILVQKNEKLNPMLIFDATRNNATKQHVEALNEIVFSRSTLELLIDSLQLTSNLEKKTDKQRLIARTRKNIETDSRTSDSFELSFFDTDPVRARDGVVMLTNHFINSKQLLDTRRYEETVKFYDNKLKELETIVSNQRDQVVSTDRLSDLPQDTEALQSRMSSIDDQLDAIEWQLFQEEEKLSLIRAFQNEANISDGIQHLYRLPLNDIQFGSELGGLLNEYDELQQQFTESYPRLRSLAGQIKQVADRIPSTIQSNMARINSQKSSLTAQKERVVSDMQRSFVAKQQASSQASDFSIYEELYNDMRVNLEEAKMTRDVGIEAAEQFIILDAATVPEKPASPNKTLILGIGLLLGIIMGVVASVLAEILDTTIRTESDLPYKKPIIAYIVNG